MDLQLTTKAQEAFAQAATTATGKHHPAIEPATCCSPSPRRRARRRRPC